MHLAFYTDSRAMQANFAAERDWEKYDTPRNLLLALVSSATRCCKSTLSIPDLPCLGKACELQANDKMCLFSIM